MDKEAYSESIVSEIIKRVIVATAAFSLLLSLVLYLQIKSTMVYVQNQAIGEEVKRVASYIEITPDGKVLHDMPVEYRRAADDSPERMQYLVLDSKGNVLFSSEKTFFNPFDLGASGNEMNYFEALSPKGEKFLGAGTRHVLGGQEFSVYAAEYAPSIQSFTNFLVDTFLYKAALVGVPLVVVLLITVIYTLRKGFEPLTKISREISGVDYNNANIRIDDSVVPVEIRPFVTAVNKAFERLKQGIEDQKEFTANAAHEIRTPLAILKARIQNLDNTQIASSLNEDVNDMTRLVNQMLDIARLDYSRHMEMKDLDLGEVVKNVCVDLGPLLIARGREVRLQGENAGNHVTGNYDAVYRAVRNIIENAIKYSPPGSPVDITIKNSAISVKDYGEPIDEAARIKIFKKFYRSASSRNMAGAGLGLSIVKKVMELHGGRVYLDPASRNGNNFVMSF